MAMIAVAVVAVGVGIYAATRTVSVPGQKLGEIAAQTAKEGEPRLIVWGTVRPIGGNLVAVQEPPRIERRKHKSGGKGGGGGSSTTTEHPHRTYAIGICEGPITGIRRVWRNNKLVYDGRPGSTWGAKNNGVFLRKARFFLGGYDQMPSADLEKIFGVGNVPAMRGTAYMVMADEDLSDMGGAVPQWLFEVVRAEGFYLTSRPYPIESDDHIQIQPIRVTRVHDKEQIRDGFPELDNAAVTAKISWLRFRGLRADVGAYELAQLSSQLERMNFKQALISVGATDPLTLDSKVSKFSLWMAAIDTAPDPESLALGVSVTRMYFHAP